MKRSYLFAFIYVVASASTLTIQAKTIVLPDGTTASFIDDSPSEEKSQGSTVEQASEETEVPGKVVEQWKKSKNGPADSPVLSRSASSITLGKNDPNAPLPFPLPGAKTRVEKQTQNVDTREETGENIEPTSGGKKKKQKSNSKEKPTNETQVKNGVKNGCAVTMEGVIFLFKKHLGEDINARSLKFYSKIQTQEYGLVTVSNKFNSDEAYPTVRSSALFNSWTAPARICLVGNKLTLALDNSKIETTSDLVKGVVEKGSIPQRLTMTVTRSKKNLAMTGYANGKTITATASVK